MQERHQCAAGHRGGFVRFLSITKYGQNCYDLPMTISYRIGAVSRITGISIDTLRAWERRYGAVVPERGDRRRDYSRAEVDRLILLRRVVEGGHSIGSVARLSGEELKALSGNGYKAESVPSLVDSLMPMLEEFDYTSLNEKLAHMAAVLSPREIVERIVLPALGEVGNRWHAGTLGVAQEHMMTSLTQQLLGTLLRLYRPLPGAVRIVFTTPEGELHAMGVLAAAMLAAGEGFAPVYLGPSLPVDQILLAARRSAAKAVVLQVAGEWDRAAQQIREIALRLPANVELWVGGGDQIVEPPVLALPDFNELMTQYSRLSVA
jgi:DNA-binding transcriptional MerR regulator